LLLTVFRSITGHGNSTRPAHFTHLTKVAFAEDLETALVSISGFLDTSNLYSSKHPRPILVAHSAGGGLSQYYCSSSSFNPELSALILIAPFPSSGGAPVFRNWAIFDPWFSLRFMWDGCDPMSPLGRPDLVKTAFFHDNKPLTRRETDTKDEESVEEFFEQMNPEENGAWPASMMFGFANVDKVSSRLSCLEQSLNLFVG
jgi:alpha-beta hydrolase superfamily lysophospholipase